jgi:hypothetical protein
VLDRDIGVLEPVGLPLGDIQDSGQPLGQEHLTRGGTGTADPRTARQVGVDGGAQPLNVRAGLLQQPGHEPVGLVDQCQQQVLSVGLGVASAHGLTLRLLQRLL